MPGFWSGYHGHTGMRDSLYDAQVKEIKNRCQAAELRVKLLEGLLRETVPLLGVLHSDYPELALKLRITEALSAPPQAPSAEHFADAVNKALAQEEGDARQFVSDLHLAVPEPMGDEGTGPTEDE